MAVEQLRTQSLPQLAVADGATTPNPGGKGWAWSTTESCPVHWDGTAWRASQRRSRDPFLLDNATITTSRSGNAETFHLKTASGADPSAADPVRVAFANTAGGFEVLELTTALSLTLSSGSTLGATSAQPFRIWLTVFNDAGTLRLGAVKCALSDGVRALSDNAQESATAEGGAGGADSAGVIYAGAAVTAKFARVLGYAEYTLTTAGTWDAAPSLLKTVGRGAKLPGDIVQSKFISVTAQQTLSAVIPIDDTIPQSNEGTEVTTVSITPTSAANRINLHAFIRAGGTSGTLTPIVALFRDSGADAIATQAGATVGSASQATAAVFREDFPGATASVSYKLRAGPSTGTMYLNGNSSGRQLGGSATSWLRVEEIMV